MWTWECFTPHPPILLPEVGGGREMEAGKSLDAMRRLGGILGKTPPSVLLILSPHSPFGGGITFSLAESYRGDFGAFGASSVRLAFPGAPEEGLILARDLGGEFPVHAGRDRIVPLDHGALVPLYFLFRDLEEEKLPRIILANPIGLSLDEAFRLGRRLAEIKTGEDTWGLLASGDLSHRVTSDAPAGYSPVGALFDSMVEEALRENDPSTLLSLDPERVKQAGECGLRSALVFLGMAQRRKVRFLSYEAPFGVGYATAYAPLHAAADLARETLEIYFREGVGRAKGRAAAARKFPELDGKAACFVTLKKKGILRGCIGTLSPRKDSLAEEIGENALSAALDDPRFPPLKEGELKDLSISVDVLSTPEAVPDSSFLDPKKYGVIVEKGGARGVLLPDLDGVDTVEAQTGIAARKAGLPSPDGASISRFTVKRIEELA
ncbi:MAG: AmmeMemoRadiSam system protein A [Aminivibrio sp.]|jgi:AmmeMemoRadiSam system protein A